MHSMIFRHGLFALLAVVLFVGPLAAEKHKKAPSFALEDLKGNEIVLDSVLSGGPVIIDFWATWCKSCDKALDMLQKLYATYKDSGLNVLAITVDSPDKISRIKPLASSRKWEFPILMDPDKKVKTLYRVMVLPTLFVLNRDGEIVYHHVGYNPRERSKLEEVLLPLFRTASDSSEAESEASGNP